jgi:Pyruvate/2-oxoacid:ferredoxin oxidoreductase gamma subunit
VTCYNCENKRRVYTKDCLGCAVRLVKSARPSRRQQEVMIGYLTAYGNLSREQIIEAMKRDSDTATA